MLEALTVKENYSLDQTSAKDIFNGVTYPWEVLPKISNFILELGATLSEDEYEKRGENVWVAKSAKVAPTAFINGPAIIGKDAEVRHCAFIRGKAIVGEGAVVGPRDDVQGARLRLGVLNEQDGGHQAGRLIGVGAPQHQHGVPLLLPLQHIDLRVSGGSLQTGIPVGQHLDLCHSGAGVDGLHLPHGEELAGQIHDGGEQEDAAAVLQGTHDQERGGHQRQDDAEAMGDGVGHLFAARVLAHVVRRADSEVRFHPGGRGTSTVG